MKSPLATSWDAIVIGGGPAGSTAAALVAVEGHRVLLLDREKFPRFRIGESLMPATYWSLSRLGVLDQMRQSHFVKKHSVRFFSGQGRGSAPFYFHEFDSHESSQTWQVVRSEFDEMLLKNAESKGVTVLQQANVREIVFEEGRATGVHVELADGTQQVLVSKVVVDASGQSAMISRKLKLKTNDDKLRHLAYFTRYKGARREPGIDEGATLVLQTESTKTWFWYIPLPNDEVSVGVVGPGPLLKQRGDTPQQVYDGEAAECPALLERIEGAQQIVDVEVLRDFSYVSRRIAGDGWILAGDAFGFLDPIYSTGVFLALKSGEFAADAILLALQEADFSGTSLGRFGEQYVAGMESMRKLVYAYYDPDFHIGTFVKKYPHCREHIVNLLVGNIYRVDTGDLFERMAEFIDLPDSRTLGRMEQVG